MLARHWPDSNETLGSNDGCSPMNPPRTSSKQTTRGLLPSGGVLARSVLGRVVQLGRVAQLGRVVQLGRLALLGSVVMASGVRAQHGTAMGLEYENLATSVKDRRGTVVPGDLTFVDENKKSVRFADYLGLDRPIVLNMRYFACPTMCGPMTQGMITALQKLRLRPGRDFEIVTVSIDPKEKPQLARDKKNAYLEEYTVAGAADHWHFLTSEESQVRRLADLVGFSYEWNEHRKVYDHGAALFVLSPDGKVTQTLLGVDYTPRDLRFAIVEASQGKVGTAWDRLLLTCYDYDPEERTYSLAVWTVVRICGALTVFAVGLMIFLLWRRERRSVVAAAS